MGSPCLPSPTQAKVDLSGTFVGYCKINFADASQALIFRADLALEGSTLQAKLQSLRSDDASINDTSGAPVSAKTGVAGNQFSLNFGQVDIPGNANPISGSDIEIGDTSLNSVILSQDSFRAELDGSLLKPFVLDLDPAGDICIFLRAPGGGSLPPRPEAVDFACTAGGGGAAGVAGAAGSSGAAGQGGGGDDCMTEEACASFKTPPGQGAGAPPPAGGGAADGPAPLLHAVSRWYLGETDRQGVYEPSAWRGYGFDLDGWSSTAKQGFHREKGSPVLEGGVHHAPTRTRYDTPLFSSPCRPPSLLISSSSCSLPSPSSSASRPPNGPRSLPCWLDSTTHVPGSLNRSGPPHSAPPSPSRRPTTTNFAGSLACRPSKLSRPARRWLRPSPPPPNAAPPSARTLPSPTTNASPPSCPTGTRSASAAPRLASFAPTPSLRRNALCSPRSLAWARPSSWCARARSTSTSAPRWTRSPRSRARASWGWTWG